ncbi:methyltransferase like 3 [Megalopta genalis]|uniref:methyltransferase like 3 n=1 Tax=Megalopta genalis TaxID=115081 RepID=UPI001443172E|nr:N6-adenosine-methyltransferase catalytic subunit isoform X1 [Megalopta genalis]XP_033341119.1 N6-adenosine-methyltransferase catalytic subunit isoform X2 [Megalopta genalis]XP_033341120.1 N6-adenosine-methyltransferase catalytic subunit isoform X1 [Megalopta genalis]XP_033341121.1 N6-adenosine-methyltransferase catalytic subunit isoform X1 [Megalopta genalis]
MSDAFEEIQAIKIKRNSLREKLQKRKRERHELFTLTSTTPVSSTLTNESSLTGDSIGHAQRADHSEYERDVLCILHESLPNLPITSAELIDQLRKNLNADVSSTDIHKILEKLAAQDIVKIKEVTENEVFGYTVLSITESQSSYQSQSDDTENPESAETSASELNDYGPAEKQLKLDKKNTEDIMSLISMPTIREKENKKVGEQILDLLSKQTSKEKSLAERFRSQGGAQVMEFCPHGTRVDCVKLNGGLGFAEKCKKLHFKKIIQSHTDESLGDCSFLNTCFHMDTCKYVHYEVDGPTTQPKEPNDTDNTNNATVNKILTLDSKNGSNVACPTTSGSLGSELTLYPPQWIQCDLRYLDMTVLGKFAVIMADPPWDIHMELPYGTMSDDEMRQLGIPALQDEGLLFLWVTGRAMELGRECLQLWGYERVDEIIWVKTNQLQRIIRTGRTGHWLNHGKEHCLVGMKGNPRINRGLDSDVIVAEVRATSHKPDEIYGIIERMSPGTRKIELFGRPHNVQPNWITLGNQVDGVHLIDPQLIKAFKKRYPDGNSMKPTKP